MELVREWTIRLENLGPKLITLRDDPESLTRQETLEVLEESDRVFRAFELIRFHLRLQMPSDSLQ
jgi:hypothetical protein